MEGERRRDAAEALTAIAEHCHAPLDPDRVFAALLVGISEAKRVRDKPLTLSIKKRLT